MNNPDFPVVDEIIPNMPVTSVKQVYQKLADLVQDRCGPASSVVYDRLMEQEAKVSSGIGHGVAFPHLRMESLDEPFFVLARLARPVDFNALDRKSVDIVCLLLSPANDVGSHLQRLSRLTRMIQDKVVRKQIREMNNEDTIRAVLYSTHERLQAA